MSKRRPSVIHYPLVDPAQAARAERIHRVIEAGLARGEQRIIVPPDIVAMIYDDPSPKS